MIEGLGIFTILPSKCYIQITVHDIALKCYRSINMAIISTEKSYEIIIETHDIAIELLYENYCTENYYRKGIEVKDLQVFYKNKCS